MKTAKDVVRCPECGGADVVYTCEPKCCFNHVCAECRASFELGTRKRGGEAHERRSDVEAPESSDVTAACAACEGLRIYVVSEEGAAVVLACADCGQELELHYEQNPAG